MRRKERTTRGIPPSSIPLLHPVPLAIPLPILVLCRSFPPSLRPLPRTPPLPPSQPSTLDHLGVEGDASDRPPNQHGHCESHGRQSQHVSERSEHHPLEAHGLQQAVVLVDRLLLLGDRTEVCTACSEKRVHATEVIIAATPITVIAAGEVTGAASSPDCYDWAERGGGWWVL